MKINIILVARDTVSDHREFVSCKTNERDRFPCKSFSPLFVSIKKIM